MARQKITNPKFWRYSLFAMPVMIPLELWAAWETVTGPDSVALQVALGVGIACVTYLCGGLLFWWNASWQDYWKSKK